MYYILLVWVIKTAFSALYINEQMDNQEVEKYGDLSLNLPEDIFDNNDNSRIFVSMKPDEVLSQSFSSYKLEKEFSFLNPNDVVVVGDFAYVTTEGFGFAILNISDYTNIHIVSRIQLGIPCLCLTVSGNYSYVGGTKFIIINIEDKKNPIVVSSTFSGLFEAIEIDEKKEIIYILYYGKNIFSVNITDKNNPLLCGTYTTSTARGLTLGDGFVYVVEGSEFRILNFTDVYNPFSVGTTTISHSTKIFYSENHPGFVFVPDGSSGFRSISCTPPITPVSADTVAGFIAEDGVIFGNYAFVTDGTPVVRVLDISNPYSMRNLNVDFRIDKTERLVVTNNNNILVNAAGEYGLELYNISNSSNPIFISNTPSLIGGEATHIQLFSSDGRIVIVNEHFHGINFYDSEPHLLPDSTQSPEDTHFKKIGSFGGKGVGGLVFEIKEMVVRGKYIYVVSQTFSASHYFIILVANVTMDGFGNIVKVNLTMTDYFELGSYVNSIAVDDECAYIAETGQIFNISSKNNISLIGMIGGIVDGVDVVVSEDTLFVARLDLVSIYDISDRSSPQLISETKTFLVDSLCIDEERKMLFLSLGSDGVQAMDVSDTQNPTLLGKIDLVSCVKVSTVNTDSQKYNFVVSSDSADKKVRIIDFGDSSNPFVVHTVDSESPSGAILRDNYLYLADSRAGIKIFKLSLGVIGKSGKFKYFCGSTEVELNAIDSKSSTSSSSFSITKEDYCEKRGECLDQVFPYRCTCEDDYVGNQCETWRCDSVDFKNIEKVCHGHGNCKSPEVCECFGGYAGKYCSFNTLLVSVMTPFLTVFSSASAILLLICCCLTFCCCCFTIVFLLITFLSLVIILVRQCLGLKKYGKLKDFDILLKEQEIEDDSSIAHLRINKDLFKIPYDEIHIISILGEGGSNSTVFKANWSSYIVAFKCFKTRTMMASQDKFDEFEREVQILGSLSHPFIIRFFGATMKKPRIGIVMEFASNGEILQYIKKFREKSGSEYPLFQKLRMLFQVCNAMSFLHSRNIIHRDLKSENVLIDRKEDTKLMDFGLSRIIERKSIQKTMRIGTDVYMAPEIVLTSEYTEKCDCFSFAILVFIVITENSNPYGDSYQVELKVANDPNFRPKIKDLESILRSVDDDKEEEEEEQKYFWISELVIKSWNHDSEKRISFEKLSEILEKGYKKVMEESKVFGKKEEDDSDNVISVFEKIDEEDKLEAEEIDEDDGNNVISVFEKIDEEDKLEAEEIDEDDGNSLHKNKYKSMSQEELIKKILEMETLQKRKKGPPPPLPKRINHKKKKSKPDIPETEKLLKNKPVVPKRGNRPVIGKK